MWGIDRLSAGELGNTRRRLRNSAVALLSQGSAVDRRGKPVLDVLEELGVRPIRLFAGEHGFDGVAQAEEAVESVAPPPRRDFASPLAIIESGAEAADLGAPGLASADPGSRNDEERELAWENEGGESVPSDRPAPSLPPEIISLYGQDKASLAPSPEHLASVDVLLID